MKLTDLRWGYVAGSRDGTAPGDRRRFAGWAKRRGITFDLIRDPSDAYDVVVLTQVADLSRWARYSGRARLVFDQVDSYLSIPRSNVKALLRGAAKTLAGQLAHPTLDYWKLLRRMSRRADAVVCCTEEQRAAILPDCRNVHVLLDMQEAEVRTTKKDYAAGAPFSLVWEGLPENVASLRVIAPALRALVARQPLVLQLVTDPAYHQWLGRYGRRSTLDTARRYVDAVELHPWTPETLSRVATAADLAVIPIPLDDRLASGKPENKLLMLWRLGLPAVVSATPAYNRAVAAAGAGIACTTEADWAAALERFMGDETLRRESGERGRAWATSEHGDERIAERWDRVFASILGEGDGAR